MQFFGAVAVTAYLSGFHQWPHSLGRQPWFFAVIAGLLNAGSSFCLYRAFETGVMSVVAPISSSYSAIAVVLSLASGERLSATHGTGIAVTLAGMMLAAVSFTPHDSASASGGSDGATSPARLSAGARLSSGVSWAIAAAIGFGFAFWWLGFHVVREVGGAASVWVVRVTTLAGLLLVAAPTRQSVRLPRGSVWWLLVIVGLTDTAAFVANNTGMQLGDVAVVTVLSSLYGAVTVLLSAVFIRDRIAASQWFGIALIFFGIVLVNL
jgi:uncharacterized membrane protein